MTTRIRRLALPLLVLLTLGPGAAPARAERLIELYRQALENNPALRTARFGIDQAAAQEGLARSRLMPQVSATGSYSWNESGDAGSATRRYNSVRSAVQLQQPLVDLGSYYKLQAARYGVAQSERLLEAERMTLASNLVDRYLTVLQAADEIANLQAEKQVVESQRRRIRLMRERELVKVTDLYEVEAYHQGLLTREIENRHVHAVALERLRELSGAKVEAVPPLVHEAFAPVPDSDATWVRESVASNPTLQALQEAIQAAEMDLRSSRADYTPRLALTVSQTHSDQGFDNKLVPAYTVGTIGLQLTIPLYEGGRVQAGTKEASARLNIAREKYEGALREVERDARTAFLNAATNHARIGSTTEEVEALTKVVESTTRSQELGVSTVVDVLAAQKRLFKARSDRQKARYDYIRDVTTLRSRAGRLGERDIEQIDAWMAAAAPAPAEAQATAAASPVDSPVEQGVVGEKAQ